MGGLWLISKESFSSIPPITLGATRLVVGGLILWLSLPAARRFRAPLDWRIPLAGLALTGTLATQYLGIRQVPTAEAALLSLATPLLLTGGAWVALRERPQAATGVGIILGAVGVTLLIKGGSGSGSAIGIGLVLGSCVCWAAYTVASAGPARATSPLEAVTWTTLSAAPMALLLSLGESHSWTLAGFLAPSTLASVAYLGVGCSAVSWYLWNRAMTGLSIAVVGASSLIAPLIGALLGHIFLGESLSPTFALGGVLISIGVVVALATSNRPTGPESVGVLADDAPS